ncbi:IucA/IucC family protein [Parendozoicomonas haliclonae]|uniref:Aerobactin synthase n=1 Tax=Parendozoicomonas haliclonae TaxID=1960125 RepID=A0A1X7ALL2_9GAMM|nr:IucA/IucC family siderophore biosynthesis protein [Parendozoicomonas haliclonae]SMA48962.1 Aerobactin synthase [Parendozoicomonas haliclonae]
MTDINRPAVENRTLWEQANRAMLAKSIAELNWEELITPRCIANNQWRLSLESDVLYRFSAWRNIWGQLVIDPNSVSRFPGLSGCCARQFYIDAQKELGMSDATLGNLLEELANTLMADCQRLAKHTLPASRLIQLTDDDLQVYLDGHPKISANKGRLGWGLDEFEQYGTEAGAKVQLLWLAAHRQKCQLALSSNVREQDLYKALLTQEEFQRLEQAMEAQSVTRQDYLLIPVHPWQWSHKLATHFAAELANKNLICLGAFGDGMQPLQSLRTLANAERPEQHHIKLPLTILNTSCYRGIPGRYITAGPVISEWLSGLAKNDTTLAKSRLIVLQEPAGAFYPHPLYEQINNAPYRFQEMLGCIWRESVASHLAAEENSVLMSALFQKDSHGYPLICEYIHQSGLSTEDWLERLFTATVIPLYHLMCRYGIGLVAHGQNITLVLKDGVPERMAIKDFQGDLRLTENNYPEQEGLPDAIKEILGRLPEKYLVHDLLTGHFVTVLRFISTALAEQNFAELRFYRCLGNVINHYQSAHPELNERFKLFDLLMPDIERICLHRVRFQQGYDDSAERPLPALGTPLKNPLFLAQHEDSPHQTSKDIAS